MTINEKPKNLGGRPTIYTVELCEKICKAIENTPRGLRWICANNPDLPTSETIREWLRNEKHPGFSAQFARAKHSQADLLADEVVDVSYEATPDKFGRVEKAKLQVESLKWKAKVTRPKKYGDKPEEEKPNDSDANLSLEERIATIVGVFDAARKRIDSKTHEGD